MFLHRDPIRGGHERSLFTYNITRHYPFKWFTPVATVGFIIATVLFSLLNFASNAYTTSARTTKDPNATLSDYHSTWVSKWPSFVGSRLQATCQAADIPVQSDLFTNQTALTYTLTSVAGGGVGDDNTTITPSLSYLNNEIQDCSVSSVMIQLESLDREANQITYSLWGATITVFAGCTINGLEGPQAINLSTTYDYVPANIDVRGLSNQFLGTNFRSRDQYRRASLWWGESCMSMYWAYLSRAMQDLPQTNTTEWSEYPIRKGIITFTTRQPAPTNITSPEFYAVNFRFIVDQGDGMHVSIAPIGYDFDINTGITALVAAQAYPNVWMQADALAKVTASTVLADLGQLTSGFPNIMADADLLTYYTANFSYMLNNIANAYPGPETTDYATAKDTTGPLQITPSVFSRTYICTVPRLKSTGSILISIVVADLVLLQTLWLVFKLIVDNYVIPKQADSNFCEGCLADRSSDQKGDLDFGNNDEIVLTPVRLSKRSQAGRRAPYPRRGSSQYNLLLPDP